MSSTHETIADIVAEKRRRAAAIRADLSTVPVRRDDQLAQAEELETEAGLIEAAHKREIQEAVCATTEKTSAVGNAAKMREALEAARDVVEFLDDAVRRDGAMEAKHEDA